jgi:type III restriction enzyme
VLTRKGSHAQLRDDLRDPEGAKIKCGAEHFKAIAVGESPVQFIKATNLDDVLTA